LDRIEPGSWLDDSGLQYFFFDHTALEPPGVIHCDLAFLDGVHAGSGQLAVLHFSARATGVTLLPFFELDVRDAENQPLVFSHSVGDSILIDPLIGAEGWSFGRVKQAFR
jgi:hypothetical protein